MKGHIHGPSLILGMGIGGSLVLIVIEEIITGLVVLAVAGILSEAQERLSRHD